MRNHQDTAGCAQALLHSVPDAFFEVNAKGIVRQHLGGGDNDPLVIPSEMTGKAFAEFWPAQTAELIIRNIRRVLDTRDGYEFEFELAQGAIRCQYEMRLLVQGRDRVLAILRNITRAVSAGGRPNRACADTLTGLATRDIFLAHFDSMVADARLRERGLAMMCIDIDRFTHINETLGRSVGDAVLRVAARRIETCLRGTDNLARIHGEEESGDIARIGGDEFMLVMTDVESRDDVAAVANRVRHAFSEPIACEDHALQVTPSIGIAMFPVDGKDAETLFINSRAALSEAKTHGSDGCSFYSDTLQFRALKRLDIIGELRWAIGENQLELHYLPRIEIGSGEVNGMEALLRWIHPLRGKVPLDELIPLAEAAGLMQPIGEWVLHTACRQAAHWTDVLANPPSVSVNLSQNEFSRDDLPEMIERTLAASGLPGNRLQLEVTEAQLMKHRCPTLALEQLKRIGVHLLIDDFGTGYSSFAWIRQLPIDAIKIDRSFVVDGDANEDRRAICGAIIAMAHELGLDVIAEGVENSEQLDFLVQRGCNAAQGFYYSRPLSASQATEFLKSRMPDDEDDSVTGLRLSR